MVEVISVGLIILLISLFLRCYQKRKITRKGFNVKEYLTVVFGISEDELNQPRIKEKMELEEFWSIIEKSKANGFEEQKIKLKNELRKLSATRIVEFDNRFRKIRNKAHRWDLWGAVYLLNGGCSDDSFDYFKEWLIGQGKRTYNNIIKDPQLIKDFAEPIMGFEGLAYCAEEVYKEMTNRNFIPSSEEIKDVPSGKEWAEEELPSMFPVIWEKVNNS